jgi:hypothetical protein
MDHKHNMHEMLFVSQKLQTWRRCETVSFARQNVHNLGLQVNKFSEKM